MNEISEWIQNASEGDKFSIARLISLIENKFSFENRKKVFSILDRQASCITVGITGTPGAGKSSLIGELCREFLETVPDKKMAIVAIDPSSSISGGAILGDRTRISIPAREKRIYFRSQASQEELGGVNPYTYHVVRLLRYFFDYVLIETVGIGQNEIEVSKLADFSFLVMQPLGGDQVQFMKSGIMEVPDAFIINKCDETELAASSYHTLSNSLQFLKEILEEKETPPIFQTSTVKRIGITELLQFILNIKTNVTEKEKETKQFRKWALGEFGKQGLKFLDSKLAEELKTDTLEDLEEKSQEIMNEILK